MAIIGRTAIRIMCAMSEVGFNMFEEQTCFTLGHHKCCILHNLGHCWVLSFYRSLDSQARLRGSLDGSVILSKRQERHLGTMGELTTLQSTHRPWRRVLENIPGDP